jgi:hypothetical protein
MAPHGEDDRYHPKDAISRGINGLLVGGGAGLLYAGVQNVLSTQNIGAWAIFTRHGASITSFASSTGSFFFARAVAANLREKDDHYNSAIGGGVSGVVLGLRTGRIPQIVALGLSSAVVMCAADYLGGLKGNNHHTADEYEQKVALRNNRRRPIEETLAELGEGRSIRPPGYEERRRERLKEKYGIEIHTVSADPNEA